MTSQKFNHQWDEWETGARNSIPKRICQHCSEVEYDVSGIWLGTPEFIKDKTHYLWELYLTQDDHNISGSLIIIYQYKKHITVVTQPIKGQVTNQDISFQGEAFSFLLQGNVEGYILEEVAGKISDDGVHIGGEVTSGDDGNVTLRLGKSVSDDRPNVSGAWLGIAWFATEKRIVVLFLDQSETVLSGILFLFYSTPSISVLGMGFGKKDTVVREDFTGELRGREITIQSVSYSFIEQGNASSWLLDTISGELNANGDQIDGIMSDEQQQSGTVTLRPARLFK